MSLSLKSLGFGELFFIQVIIWTSLWLIDEYLASLLTVVMVPIFFFILIVAVIAELIERSKVPKRYFGLMLMSIFIPLAIAIFTFFAFEGSYSWLQEL